MARISTQELFGGRSLRTQRFKLSFNPKTNKVVFEFESGTKLGIEIWKIVEAIEFLKSHDVVVIGGRISEEYPIDSLEGHLKDGKNKTWEKDGHEDCTPYRGFARFSGYC